MSWVSFYVGGQWSQSTNCWYWFRKVQFEIFNIDVLACKTLADKRKEYLQWLPTSTPREGDAVWMTQAGEPHHIGVWTGSGVLHAAEGQGVIHETVTQLSLTGWRVERFERHV